MSEMDSGVVDRSMEDVIGKDDFTHGGKHWRWRMDLEMVLDETSCCWEEGKKLKLLDYLYF